MSTPAGVADIKTRRQSDVQAKVSMNVKVMMAVKDLDQAGIGAIIGKTGTSIGHKLHARSRWSIEEVEALADEAGWDVARFFVWPAGYSPDSGVSSGCSRGGGQVFAFPGASEHGSALLPIAA